MPSSLETLAPGEEFLLGQSDYLASLAGAPIAVPQIDGRGGLGTVTRDQFVAGDMGGTNPGGVAAMQSMIADLLSASNNLNQGGLSLYEQTRSMVGWVYVAIRAIRNAVSKTPLKVYQRSTAGKETEIIDQNNELVRLLSVLNPMDTKSEFWSQTVTFYKLTGNAFWVKVRDGMGKVRELWVLPTQYLRPAFTREGLLGGYWLTTGVGEMMVVPAQDLVHFRNPNPRDRYWGWGDLSAAADALKSQNQIKAAQLAAFSNDILSTIVFQCEQQLTTPTWTRMMAQLKERYAGAQKAGTPLLMEGGTEVNFLNRAPAEMAFRESAQFTRDEILSIFGVPPLLAGLVDSAYNTTDSQERMFEAYCVAPFLRDLAERIEKDLVPEFGGGLAVRFDNPVAEDRKLEADLDKTYVEAGIVAPNEIRKKLGLKDEKWGVAPQWVIQAALRLQMVIQAKAQQQLPPADDPDAGSSANTPAAPADSDEEDTDNNDTRGIRAVRRRIQNVQVERPSPEREPGRRSPPLVLEAKTRQPRRVWKARLLQLVVRVVDSDYTNLQRETVPTIRRYFSKQSERIKENVERLFKPLLAAEHQQRVTEGATRRIWCVSGGGMYRARLFPDGATVAEIGTDGIGKLGRAVDVATRKYTDGEWLRVQVRKLEDSLADQLDDWEKAADMLAERMIPKLREALETGAAMQNNALSMDFELPSVDAEAWLRHKDRTYWKNTVNATTKSWLSERLSQVMEEGPTMEKLIDAVEEVMGDRINSSSEGIARTETIGAYNAGANIVRKKAGVKNKEWVSTLDNRVRQAHEDAHGQVVKQSEQFNVGGELLEYPGDPKGSVANIINCRCTSVAVLDDDDDSGDEDSED